MKQTRLQRAWAVWLELPQGLRPGILGAAAIVLMTLVLMLWPAPSRAEEAMIVRNGDNWLRLSLGKCENAQILAQLKDEWADKFRAARAQVNGQDFQACWIEQGGQVFVLFDDGDKATIPTSAFKPDGA